VERDRFSAPFIRYPGTFIMTMSFQILRRAALIAGTAVIVAAPAVPANAGSTKAKNVVCKGCVGAKDIGKKAVRGRHLAPGSVKEFAIKDGAVTGNKISDGTIKSSHLKDGDIDAEDLAESAQPAGADNSSGDQSVPLDGSADVIRSVAVTAPGPGVIVAVASGNFSLQATSGGTCSISDDTAIDLNYGIQGFNSNAQPMVLPFGGTRLFEVASAGETTLNLVCYEPSGSATIIDTSLSAIFVPNRY